MIDHLIAQARKRWNAKRHMMEVAALGCLPCKLNGHEDTPAELHHSRDGLGWAQRASDYEVIPLCSAHHRLADGTGNFGGEYAFHNNQPWFEEKYGTEPEMLAIVYRELGL